MEVKRKYLGFYRASLLKLYDLNYVSDPTCLNLQEIQDVLHERDSESLRDFQSGKEIISLGVGGKDDWNSDHFGYLALINKDEDVKRLLEALRDMFYYREQVTQIDNFYNYHHSQLEQGKSIKLEYRYVGSLVQPKGTYKICEGVIECYYPLKNNEVVKYCSISPIIYNKLCEDLNATDGLITGLTKEEEIRYLPQFLNGDERVTKGLDKTGKLVEKLREYAWVTKGTRTRTGYFNEILSAFNTSGIYPVSETLNKCIEEYGLENIVGADSTGIYYKEKVDRKLASMGGFAIICSDTEMLFTNNLFGLDGISGEFYDVKYLDEQGILYLGCPINVRYYDYYGNLRSVKCVDIEQTEFYTEGESLNTWFSSSLNSIGFDDSPYESLFGEGSCEEELHKLFCDYHNGNPFGTLNAKWTKEELDERKDFFYRKFLKYKTKFIRIKVGT